MHVILTGVLGADYGPGHVKSIQNTTLRYVAGSPLLKEPYVAVANLSKK